MEEVPGTKIVLGYYPFAVWNRSHHGSWNLHGHSHGSFPSKGKQPDVGVDVHNYTPISIEQVAAYMETQDIYYSDHH